MAVEVGLNQIVPESSAIEIAKLYSSIHQLATNFWADTQGMCYWAVGIFQSDEGNGRMKEQYRTRNFSDCGQRDCELSGSNPVNNGRPRKSSTTVEVESKHTVSSNPN